MEDASSGPSRPDGGSNLQFALLSLGRQLSGPPRLGLENSSPLGAPQATTGGARPGLGERRVPPGPEGPNIGAGPKGKKVSGDLKLYRYDLQDRHCICGGIISRRGGGANRFCVPTNCGFAHDKKAFDRLEDRAYYIVELGRGRGAGSSQQPWALLDPLLPKAAAKCFEDNHEVLAAENSMQGWLSLFRYLVKRRSEETLGPLTQP